MEKLLSPAAVAEQLSVSKMSIYRLVDSGKLQASKIGGSLRFRQKDVDKLFEENLIQNRR